MKNRLPLVGWAAPTVLAVVLVSPVGAGPIGQGLGTAAQHIPAGVPSAAVQGLQNGQTGQDLAAVIAQTINRNLPANNGGPRSNGSSSGHSVALQHVPSASTGHAVVQGLSQGMRGLDLAATLRPDHGSQRGAIPGPPASTGLSVALDRTSNNSAGLGATVVQNLHNGLTGQDLANSIRPLNPPVSLPPSLPAPSPHANAPMFSIPAPPTMLALGLAVLVRGRRRD